MTVIAAAVTPNVAAIASDTYGTSANRTDPYGPKVIHVFDGVAVGYAGTYVLDRWLRRTFGPALGKKARLWRDDADAFHELVEDSWDQWLNWNSGRGPWDASTDGICLVVAPGILLELSNGFVLRHGRPYAAVGDGDSIAAGALCVMADETCMNPPAMVERAVKAAVRHVPSCGGDPWVIEVRR